MSSVCILSTTVKQKVKSSASFRGVVGDVWKESGLIRGEKREEEGDCCGLVTLN